MGYEWVALLMFGVFVGLILWGYPVAFSFAGTAVVFTLVGLQLDAFESSLLNSLPNRWFGLISDQTLLAIPYFVFMGAVLEKSGLAERLLKTVGMMLGNVRGGLALTVIVVGAMLAAATGVVAATVVMMGLISLPAMVRTGYDHRVATGVIVASGTLAQIIPPSLVLIVLSQVVGVSVGDLYRGAFIPGLLLAVLYAAYIVYLGIRHPERVPPLPPEERTLHGPALAKEAAIAVVPPIALIVAVLGSILTGTATPTEAGAVGAFAACLLAVLNRRFQWTVVLNSARTTLNVTSLVLMMLFASNYFSLIFDGLGGQRWITEQLSNLPGGFWTFLIVANIVVFLLGINLEFLEITFIVMPIFLPVAQRLGIDLTWFSVMMAVNLNAAFISPPVGFSLFYLQSVAPPEVKTIDIHRGAIPFMWLQGVALLLVMLFPALVTWLPSLAK